MILAVEVEEPGMRPLGEVLADDGDLTIRRLRRASEYQKKNGGSIEAALLATGALTEEVLTNALSRASGLPAVTREKLLAADPAVVDSLPVETRRRLRALPFDWCGVRLSVAVSDPSNTVLETGLVAASGYDTELFVIPDPILEECLVSWERRGAAAPSAEPAPEPAPEPAVDMAPVERLGKALLTEAVRHDALALELSEDTISAYSRTLHFKVPPMTRRFDARLLPPLCDWYFTRAGLEGNFALSGREGMPLKRVVVEKTGPGLILHFRDPEEGQGPAREAPCSHIAAPGDVFCPVCGAAV